MEVIVLASGSSGNSALVVAGGTTLLIDSGISNLAIRRRLAAVGRCVDDIDGVLLTHEHSDHVRGLDVLLRRSSFPVWASHGTWSRLPGRGYPDGSGELRSARPVRFGSIEVSPVQTSHDAAEPLALVLDDGDSRLGLCTDTGVVTSLLAHRLRGCSALLIEANHDLDLLRYGPYPWPLKQRIRSRLGHLSNGQTAEAVGELAADGARAVVGVHLSETNNDPALVQGLLAEVVGDETRIDAVSRNEMLRLVLDRGAVEMRRFPAPATRRPRPQG